MTIQSIHKQEAGYCGKKFWLLIFAIGLMSVLPSNVQGQIEGVKNGDRVKIFATVNERPIKGTVTSLSPTVLTVVLKDTTLLLPYAVIQKMEISSGKKRNFGKGALIGSVMGGLMLGGMAAYKKQHCNDDEWCFNPGFVGGFKAGAIYGGILGGFIGIMSKSDRWEEVPFKISAGIAPTSFKKPGIESELTIWFTF